MAESLAPGMLETEPVQPTVVPSELPAPEPTPPLPDLAAQLQQERERAARLEGELTALRRQPLAAPSVESPAPPRPALTPDSIETAYSKGEITDSERTRLYARLESQKVVDEARTRDRAVRLREHAEDRLAEIVQKNPELTHTETALFREVQQELRQLGTQGWDVEDPRVQVVAAEKVLAMKKPSPAAFDVRRPIPGAPAGNPGSSGTGEPAGKPESKGKQLFERLTDEAKQFYVSYHGGDLQRIYKTLDFADEAMLRRSGRLAR